MLRSFVIYTVHKNIIWLIISRRMRQAEHILCMMGMRNAYKILGGILQGKRPPGRHRHRWKGNIKIDLKKLVWEWPRFNYVRIGFNDILCENSNEMSGSVKVGNLLIKRATISFQKKTFTMVLYMYITLL